VFKYGGLSELVKERDPNTYELRAALTAQIERLKDEKNKSEKT